MKRIYFVAMTLLLAVGMMVPSEMLAAKKQKRTKAETAEVWPDGTPMDKWFKDTTKVDIATLGRQYVITDYGVVAGSSEVQTRQIQAVIDRCAQEGGGVVVVPAGTFVTGALFFRQGTHLHVAECGTL